MAIKNKLWRKETPQLFCFVLWNDRNIRGKLQIKMTFIQGHYFLKY